MLKTTCVYFKYDGVDFFTWHLIMVVRSQFMCVNSIGFVY